MIRIAEPLVVARHSTDMFEKECVLNEGSTPKQVCNELKKHKNIRKCRKSISVSRTKKY